MLSAKRANPSADAEAPAAQRIKPSNSVKPTTVIDLTEENKENIPTDGIEKSEYPEILPSQGIAPWSATAQNYNREAADRGWLPFFEKPVAASNVTQAKFDEDLRHKEKAGKEENAEEIRQAMTLPPEAVFLVESEDEQCLGLNKTLDGALRRAVEYLDDYGYMDIIRDGLVDVNEPEVEDEDLEWRNVNMLLDVAHLRSVDGMRMLRIETEDEQFSDCTITIKQMKVGA